MHSAKARLPAWGGAIYLQQDSVLGPGDDEASQHLVYVLIVALVGILYTQPTLWLLCQLAELIQGDNVNVASCVLPVSITLLCTCLLGNFTTKSMILL